MSQQPPIIPLAAKILRLARLTNGEGPITINGTLTSTSPDVTALGSATRIAIGAAVTGVGVPADTTVIAIDEAAHTATLSNNATASGVKALTFTNPAYPGPLKFRLGKVNRSLNAAVQLSDLTPEEADFDNYPAGGITLSYSAGYITPGGVPSNESQLLVFMTNLNPPVVTNTVYYWWIDDGTTVWMCQSFENPVAMATFGAALKVMVEDSYPPGIPAVQVVP